MGSRLNIDGAKIKTFRIQRGWTQEQLAEIAGVSARTIQRAETGGCAAFETLRAVAVAFDVDFDQLLKSETRDICDPEPEPMPQSAPPAASGPQLGEIISVVRPALSVRRTWAILQVATAAMTTGLLTVVILIYWFDTPRASRFLVPRQNLASVAHAGTGHETRDPDTKMVQVPVVLRTSASPATEATIIKRESEPVTEKPRHQTSNGPADEKFQLADLASQTKIVSSPQPAFLDLPPRSRTLDGILTIPALPGGWHTASILPGDFTGTDQGTGAVRQAVGQAAKKTGDCFAKVGASMRRAF